MASRDYELDSNHYMFLKCIGEGDFGEVWKCMKYTTQQFVAVKIPNSLENGEDEVRLFAYCLLERLYGQK